MKIKNILLIVLSLSVGLSALKAAPKTSPNNNNGTQGAKNLILSPEDAGTPQTIAFYPGDQNNTVTFLFPNFDEGSWIYSDTTLQPHLTESEVIPNLVIQDNTSNPASWMTAFQLGKF